MASLRCASSMALLVSIYCFSCFGPTEGDSVASQNTASVGGKAFVHDSLDECRLFYSEIKGEKRVFRFLNSELNEIRFELDSSITDFVLVDSQLVHASALVSFKKEGPSWSHRLRGGLIQGKRDSDGNWRVKGEKLTSMKCSGEEFTFSEQQFANIIKSTAD